MSANKSFNLRGFLRGDNINRHSSVHQDWANRISEYCQKYHGNMKYNRLNPFVIADIGCGNGEFTLDIVKDKNIIPFNINNITTYLIDPNVHHSDDSDDTDNSNNNSNKIFKMTADEFVTKCGSNYCDIIICKGVAPLLPNFNKFLLDCQRILKTNGILYITFLSNKLDFTHFWGNKVQSIYNKSRMEKNEAYNWIDYYNKNNMVNSIIDNKYGKFSLKHCQASQKIIMTNKEAKKFIENRAWSYLQNVDKSVIDEIIETCIKNNDSIDIVVPYTVTEMIKIESRRSKVTQSKL